MDSVTIGFCDVVSAPLNSASRVVDSMSPTVRWTAGSRRQAGSVTTVAGATAAAGSSVSARIDRPNGHHFGIGEVSQLLSAGHALN
jgi:hypothetical protein